MKPRANELVAGIFVIIMLLFFIVFLGWSSGRLGEWWNRREIEMNTWFHNTGGLKPKVQVTYQGLKIGDVRSIEYDPAMGLIRVRMSVNADFTDANLPETAVAMITSASLLGDPYIELTSDFRLIAPEMLVRHDTRVLRQKNDSGEDVLLVDAIDPAGWGTIQVQASNLLSGIQEQFGSMADTVGSILRSTDAIVSDPQLKQDIDVTMARVRVAAENLPATVADARSMMASANSAAVRVDNMLAESEDTVATILRNTDELTFNARALTYTLAEKPSRLVWEDKERQRRLAAGDTSVIYASFRNAGAAGVPGAAPASSGGSVSRPVRTGYGNYVAPAADAPAAAAPSNATTAPGTGTGYGRPAAAPRP